MDHETPGLLECLEAVGLLREAPEHKAGLQRYRAETIDGHTPGFTVGGAGRDDGYARGITAEGIPKLASVGHGCLLWPASPGMG